MKEKVREEMGRHGIDLSADEIDVVTEAALNQITGVAYKGRYYEEMISYALKDLNFTFLNNLSGSVGRDRFSDRDGWCQLFLDWLSRPGGGPAERSLDIADQIRQVRGNQRVVADVGGDDASR